MENDNKKLFKMMKEMINFFESEPKLSYNLHKQVKIIHETMKEIMGDD